MIINMYQVIYLLWKIQWVVQYIADNDLDSNYPTMWPETELGPQYVGLYWTPVTQILLQY